MSQLVRGKSIPAEALISYRLAGKMLTPFDLDDVVEDVRA